MLQAASGSSFLFNITNAHFDSALLHLSARLTHPYFAMRACTRPPRFRFASSRCSFAFSHNITKGRFSLQAASHHFRIARTLTSIPFHFISLGTACPMHPIMYNPLQASLRRIVHNDLRTALQVIKTVLRI